MSAADDTIAAIATAAGRGGIGIIRISGPACEDILTAVTGRKAAPRTASFVRFRDRSGAIIDEGIALSFPAPASYTGENVVELHGHGGPAVLAMLLGRCLELGARIAEPGEFTRRAFLNDKLDLAQAEAVADLIEASTERAVRSAARTLTGEFSRRVDDLQTQLTDVRVLLEASLDFPEEDVDVPAAGRLAIRLSGLAAEVSATLQAARQGSMLREGVTVALIGPPNVGKSSLINALSRDDVAIVTPIAGTTRDVIRRSVSLRGIPVHLIDTAGLRVAQDPVEEAGIARTWCAAAEADVVLLISDLSEPTSVLEPSTEKQLPSAPRIRVLNKTDAVGESARIETGRDGVSVWISAKTGAGIDLLEEALSSAVSGNELSEGVFSARERHVQALREALHGIERAAAHIDQAELAAEELRVAQRWLSELTGEMVADDLLGQIFSRFCIGK